MRPRKDIFAANYILETVKTYVRLSEVSNEWVDRDQLKWAHDVLLEYFSVVSRHPEIEKARCLFNESKYCTHETIFAPYKRDLSQPISVDYDQFLKLCFRRRSVRWYTEKQVPRELLDQAIAAAALSPSACNRQPFKFRVFDQPVLVQEVASLAGGARGFFHNFPVVIVVVGQLRAYFAEKDRHIIYIDSSLASMTLMFALESLGLSSCSINWPDIDIPEEKMKRLLNLEQDERPIMLISVGYPDPEGMVPYSQKKNLEDIRKYN